MKLAIVYILQRCFENKQVTALYVVFLIRSSWSAEVASLTAFVNGLEQIALKGGSVSALGAFDLV